MHAMIVAVDFAKTVFELAVANGQWRLTARHRFNRRQFARFLSTTPTAHVVMETCGTAHYWGRVAQRHGHRVTRGSRLPGSESDSVVDLPSFLSRFFRSPDPAAVSLH